MEQEVQRKNTPDNVLASLFRRFLQNLNMTEEKWQALIDDYVAVQPELTDQTLKAAARANINKTLAADEMTWKVFCKGLQILRVDMASINLTVTRFVEPRAVNDTAVMFALGGESIESNNT